MKESTTYTKILSNIGISMPQGFPIQPYELVHERLRKKIDSNKESWQLFAEGWNAFAYRFLACSEHNESFSSSIVKDTISPQPKERYNQDNELFGFFVTGLSCFESAYFSLYVIASILDLKRFPISPDEKLVNVTPGSVTKNFKSSFPCQKITKVLENLICDSKYEEWKSIRNVLAHRANPGRKFNSDSDYAVWKIKGIDIVVDKNFAFSRFEWLKSVMATLFNQIDVFTSTRL
jgi:hypothetical protein